MILFNAYKYLYYRIYAWQLRCWGKEDLPQISALVGISVFAWLNICGLFFAVNALTKLNITNPMEAGKFNITVQYLFILLINSFIFIRKKRYERIAEQFSNENITERRTKLILIFAYIIFSIVILFAF